MIKSFACKETERIWNGDYSRRLPTDIQQLAKRKLRYLHFATGLEDLRSPPSNRLEGLKGDKKGYYSIRINRQWRICFIYEDAHAYEVRIIDYH